MIAVEDRKSLQKFKESKSKDTIGLGSGLNIKQ
jgi:hypothetical protein